MFVALACNIIETNDLIYEGIATNSNNVFRHFLFLRETNDLIYEGIATARNHDIMTPRLPKQTTWFTKGLRLSCDGVISVWV